MLPDLLLPTDHRRLSCPRAARRPAGSASRTRRARDAGLHPIVWATLLAAMPAFAGVPDLGQSFFVPQTGPVGTPTEGVAATALFKACPNNDGGTSLPNNARVKVMLRDVNGYGIPGIAAADICLLFNGGTAVQGFTGAGADSVIANSRWNQNPLCPDVRAVCADAPSDSLGVTYITFTGTDGTVAGRGIGVRDPNRKWGHYDSEIPVYVLGFKIPGKLTSLPGAAAYTLRVKNFDMSGGLAATLNQGEAVTTVDYNTMVANLNKSNIITYWLDFNNSNSVTTLDYNQLVAHLNHNCITPFDDTPPPVEECPGPSAIGPAQPIVRCGTVVKEPMIPAPGRSVIEAWIKENRIAEGGVIPVNFHVLHSGSCGNVPESRLDAQITVMNYAFAGKDYNGTPVPGAANTGYTFVKNSVTRTDSATWYAMTPWSPEEIEAKTALVVNPTGSLNFYTCYPGEVFLGWSTFPSDLAVEPNMDGVVVHYGALPGGYLPGYNLGGTGIHEVGHWVGLYHTFEGGCHEDSLCAVMGDEVCDTPAEATPNWGCPIGRDTCVLSAGLDPIENYMDYSGDYCFTNFTPGQDARADFMMSTYRPLIGSAAIPSTVASLPRAGAAETGAGYLRVVPNPFNPSTSVEFSLDRSGPTSVLVFDVQGRRVATLADRFFEAGPHRLVLVGAGLPSGVYWLVLRTDDVRVVRRLTLLK